MNIQAKHKKNYYINKSVEVQQRSIGKLVKETQEEKRENIRIVNENRDLYENEHIGG